jgi:hypothetical protein
VENGRFKDFKEKYLERFRKYYNECYNAKQRRELKKSVFDNGNLSGTQKKKFWEEVIENER